MNRFLQTASTIKFRVTAANLLVVLVLVLVGAFASAQLHQVGLTVEDVSRKTELVMRLGHALDNRDDALAAVRRGLASTSTRRRAAVLVEDMAQHGRAAVALTVSAAAAAPIQGAVRHFEEAARLLRSEVIEKEDLEVAAMQVEEAVVDGASALGLCKIAAVSSLEAELRSVRRDVREPLVAFLWAAGGATLLALAILWLVRRRVIHPIEVLRRSAHRLERGEEARVVLPGRDELSELGSAFNSMADAIADRERSLRAALGQVQLVLDNTGDGLAMATLDGQILGEVSAAARRWFGEPGAEPLWSYVCGAGAEAREATMMEMGFAELRSDIMPEELVVSQLPTRVIRGDQTYELAYRVVPGVDAAERRVLLVARDITEDLQQQRERGEAEEVYRVLANALRDLPDLLRFLRECEGLIEGLPERDAVERARDVHTLKGNCAVYGLSSIARACHALEDRLTEDPNLPAEVMREELRGHWGALRRRVEQVMTLDGEDTVPAPRAELLRLIEKLRHLGPHTQEIAEQATRWQYVPVERPLSVLARGASALARRLGRAIDVEIEGGGIRVDPESTGALWSVLSHVVRNAVDHGIETPPERDAAGKPPRGRVSLRCAMEQHQWRICISDDGKGIDWERVRALALQRGLAAETREDLVSALFADGFSTREEVSETSGRGVGMAALRPTVAGLGGRVELDSTLSVGTQTTIILPAARGGMLLAMRASPPPVGG